MPIRRLFNRRVLPENIYVYRKQYVAIRIKYTKDNVKKLHFEYVGRIDDSGIWTLAEARRDKIREEIKSGKLGIEKKNDPAHLSFKSASEIFTKLYVTPTKEGASVKNFEYHLALICEFFGDKTLDQVGKEEVQHFRNWLEKRGKGNCDASQNRVQAVLTCLYNRFYEWREDRLELKDLVLPRENPSELCKKPNTDYRDRTVVLTEEEWARAYACGDDRIQRIIIGLSHSALRQCDLKRLRISENIDRDRNCFVGFQKKTGRKKKKFEPPITPEMWTIIETAKSDLIFDFRQKKRRWHRMCVRAGFVDASGKMTVQPRDIRRTTGRTLLKEGADIDTVRAYLGHASIKTTQRYVGSNRTDLNRAATIVSAKFKIPAMTPTMPDCSNCGNRPADRFENNGLCVYCIGSTKRKWRPMVAA